MKIKQFIYPKSPHILTSVWAPSGHVSTMILPLRAYGVAVASVLAGASLVHTIYSPDLTIPAYEAAKPASSSKE